MPCGGDKPPASAQGSLQNHVMRLRALLDGPGDNPIKTVAPGYLIEVAAGDLDLHEFARRYRHGRSALAERHWESASGELAAALGLWRGEPLADVSSSLLREREVPRLEQLRLDALDARIEADLHLGRGDEVIAELVRLVAVHPLQERLYGQLMMAYYQVGRQAEALSAYARARSVLQAELGVEPGPDLQQLHEQVLAGKSRPSARQWLGAAARPAQLTADLLDFTGRDDQVQALTRLLSSAGQRPGVVPVCVVTGPGGIGKTSLAIHAGHLVHDRFPDGQLLVRLGGAIGHPAKPERVLGRFLRDLGTVGNAEWEGSALQNLAAIASTTGDHASAVRLFDQAIALLNQAGDRYQEITALIDSGHAFTRSAQPGKAYQRWQQARAITVETGDPRITAIDSLLAGNAGLCASQVRADAGSHRLGACERRSHVNPLSRYSM